MAKLTAFWLLLVISLEMSHFAVMTRDSMRAVIPGPLTECYRNRTLLQRDNLLPMTMSVLIDLIRKVETYQAMNMDMRTLATTLLQRFRLDGIERDPEVQGNDFVIPYRPAGSEFYKYRFLMDSLIPNQQYSFPNDSLSMVEQCTLHWMLSSSVDRWVRGDEGTVCGRLSNYASWNSRIKRQVPQVPQASAPQRTKDPDAEILDQSALMNDMARKPSNDYQNYQPSFGYPRGALASDYSLSSCPIENGVVYTNYGAVKAGILLAGVAAGLQPQTVTQNNLVQAIRSQGRYNPPSPQMTRTGANYNPVGLDYSVKNTWAATLSGELAQVAILQGPAYRQAMRIGLGGGWNNTLVPRYYFLGEESKDAFTEADIRGSIDGLMIASNVMEWNRLASGSLRLSQMLEMYYSEFGVFDVNNRACMRRDRFSQIAPLNLLQKETENFAFVLQYEQPSSVNLLPEAIQELTNIAVSKLTSSVSSFAEQGCANVRQSGPTSVPAADLYLVIDTIWEFNNIQGVLSSIIEKCDVNPYGSKVTLINGKDGSVLVNTTQHITEFHQNFTFNSYNMYQRGFDMAQSLRELQTIFEIEANLQKQSITGGGYQYNKYYDNSYDSYSSSYSRPSYSSSYGTSTPSKLPKVVIFIPSNTASGGDGDINFIRNRIWYFKTNLPDVKLLYFVSSSKERYSQFADNPNKDIYSLTVSTSATDTSSSISPLVARIAEVPRPIENPTCGSSWVGRWYSPVQSTGYLQPNGIHYYKLHPNYFYKSTDAKIRVQSQGSVTLSVCQSRSNPLPSGNRTMGGGDVYCKQISSDAYELRISEGTCGDLYGYQCQPYYISVSVSQSQSGSQSANNVRCQGDDCRYPNMIKYTISHEGLTCYSGVIRVISNPILVLLLIFISVKDYF